MKIRFATLFFLLLAAGLGAQSPDSLPAASTLTARLSYESQALAYGRDFDISQFLLLPSLSYNHVSGFSASASGLWFSDGEPAYSQTSLRLDYGRSTGDHFFWSLGYGRTFFHPLKEGLLNNELSVYTSWTAGAFSLSAGYGFLFGRENAHRLSVSLGAYRERETKAGKVLSIQPSLSLTMGTENVSFYRYPLSSFESLSGIPWLERRLLNRPPRPGQVVMEEEKLVFGPLALQASLPLQWRSGHLSLSLAPQFVVPFELTAESFERLESTIYVNAGIGWILHGR